MFTFFKKYAQKLLISIFALTKRVGLLQIPTVERLFVSSYFLYKNILEDPYAWLLKKYPKLIHDGNVIDVGANIGYTAALFSKYMSEGFRVFAFEPEIKNFSLLERTIKGFHLESKIIAFQKAVGETNKNIPLWINPNHSGDHRIITDSFKEILNHQAVSDTVEMTTLDSFLKSQSQTKNLSFVKIDVQGYELQVCKGMKETLKKYPNIVIAIEYDPHCLNELGFDPSELLEYIWDSGFKSYIISPSRGLIEFQKEVPSWSLKKGYVDLLFTKTDLGRFKA